MKHQTDDHANDRGIPRFVTWLLVVTIVLLGGNLIRGEQINGNADRGRKASVASVAASHDAQAAAEEAAAAAKKASTDLAAAIASSSNPEAQARTLEAFNALFDTRKILCAQFPSACAKAGVTLDEGAATP